MPWAGWRFGTGRMALCYHAASNRLCNGVLERQQELGCASKLNYQFAQAYNITKQQLGLSLQQCRATTAYNIAAARLPQLTHQRLKTQKPTNSLQSQL